MKEMMDCNENLQNQKPPYHLFLTGEIQVGKSTAIARALAAIGIANEDLTGFRTIAGPRLDDGSDSIHIVAVNREDPVSDKNMAFRRGVFDGERHFQVFPETFNEYGCQLLQEIDHRKLVLMDEIGTAEAACQAFHNQILECLDNSLPILGVVQIRPGGFLDEIRQHPNVSLLTVTKENRDQLVSVIVDFLRNQGL